MLECKPNDTPIDLARKTEDIGDLVQTDSYERSIGKLINLSHTRLDIAFAVGMISQHMHSPKQNHMKAIYRIVKYLKRTLGK